MASEQPDLSKADIAFIQRFKVTLATAIIREKPVGCSGKEYAQQLAGTLKTKERDWKQKALQLEEKLLQTKQELALTKMKIRTIPAEEGANLEETQISDFSMDVDVLTPPSSSSEGTCSKPDSSLSQILQRNSHFLFSLSRLKNKSLIQNQTNKEFKDTMMESFKFTINHILEYVCHCKRKGKINHYLMDAVKALVGVLDVFPSEEDRKGLIELLEKLNEDLLSHISNSPQDILTFDTISRILEQFGQSKHLLGAILKMLLHRIQSSAAHLKSVITDGGALDPAVFSSSFFSLRTLEHLLSIDEGVGQRKQVVNEELRLDLVNGLEDSLLHITDQFPLFAQYVWKILGMLEWLEY